MRLVLLAMCGVLALQVSACGVKRGLKTPSQIEREEQKKATKKTSSLEGGDRSAQPPSSPTSIPQGEGE